MAKSNPSMAQCKTEAPAAGGGHTFSGRFLGWTPVVTTQDPAQDVVAGSAVAPGTDPGLAGSGLLASATVTRGDHRPRRRAS